MSKSYYQCLLFKQFTTRRTTRPLRELKSKSYYQCLLFILQRYAYFSIHTTSVNNFSDNYFFIWATP